MRSVFLLYVTTMINRVVCLLDYLLVVRPRSVTYPELAARPLGQDSTYKGQNFLKSPVLACSWRSSCMYYHACAVISSNRLSPRQPYLSGSGILTTSKRCTHLTRTASHASACLLSLPLSESHIQHPPSSTQPVKRLVKHLVSQS